MSGFIGDLLEGIASFVTDVWVLRRQRAASNRGDNAWSKDAADVVLFNAWAIGLSVLAFAAAAVMFLALGVPFWLSLVPIAGAGAYLGYRWMALARA